MSHFAIEWAEYITRENSGWVQYERKTVPFSFECCKIHISINRDDFLKAKDIIIPILKNHGLSKFKCISDSVIERISLNSNQKGKEFCVYFSTYYSDSFDKQNTIDEFLQITTIVKEIESELFSKGIKKGFPSKGDMQVPKANYCYFRSPKSISGRYLSAEFLEEAGFTREEAANISLNSCFPQGWQKKINFCNLDIPHQIQEAEHNERSQAIMNQFLKDSWYEGRGFHNPLPNLLILLQGTEKLTYRDYSGEFVGSFFTLFDDNDFDIHSNKLSTKVWKKIGAEEGQDLPDFFKDVLKKESIVLSAEFERKDIEQTALPGNILPAIYHGIFVPYHNSKKDKEGDFNFDDLPQFIEDNEGSIISYIVSAGLRDRGVSQMRNSDPVLL